LSRFDRDLDKVAHLCRRHPYEILDYVIYKCPVRMTYCAAFERVDGQYFTLPDWKINGQFLFTTDPEVLEFEVVNIGPTPGNFWEGWSSIDTKLMWLESGMTRHTAENDSYSSISFQNPTEAFVQFAYKFNREGVVFPLPYLYPTGETHVVLVGPGNKDVISHYFDHQYGVGKHTVSTESARARHRQSLFRIKRRKREQTGRQLHNTHCS
jgi:hypothetical protein